MKEIEKISKRLRKYLYTNNTEITDIDKTSFQKEMMLLIRECIKQKEYEVEIGSYTINIDPENIMVEYENDDTSIRITKNDVYFETNREVEIRYFIPSNVQSINDEYNSDSPVIRTTGLITNIDGYCEERYNLELFNIDENIMDYINIPSNMQLSPYTEPTKYSIILVEPISVNDERLDLINIFKESKVIPVIYDKAKDKYLKTSFHKEYNPNNYSNLLPNLENRKNIVSFIYNLIVDFYNEYINNNL